MNLKHLLAATLACAALFACTKETPGDKNLVKEDGNAYIKVNIAFADGLITRASENDGYVAGSEDEYAIKSIYFAFYDDNGNFVTESTMGSPTWDENANPDTENNDAEEKTGEAIISLTLVEGNPYPTKMLAFVNTPPADIRGKSYSDIKSEITGEYSSSDGFLMTNSVYKDINDQIVDANILKESDFKATEDEAKTNSAVKVHVERLASKVIVKWNNPDIDNQETVNNYSLQFVPSTWGLTGTNKKSYYIKNIEGFNPDANDWIIDWNKSNDFRSFWAIDPNYGDSYTYKPEDFAYTTFGECTNMQNTQDYCRENTLTYENYNKNSSAATHIVLTGSYKVFDSNNQEVTNFSNLYMRFGKLYIDDELIQELSNSGNLFTADDDNNPQVYSKAGQDAYIIGKAGNGCVTLKINVNATTTYYYKENNRYTKLDKTNDTIVAKLNEELLANCGTATVYNAGNGYFTVPIKHFGNEGKTGYVGVVRNHLYELTINSIKNGLANGVFDDDDIIIPQPPTETVYLATTLHILSWKKVSQGVDL